MGRRTLTEADRDAWSRYTLQIEALPGRPVLPSCEPATPLTPAQRKPAPARIAKAKLKPSLSAIAVGERPIGIDTGSWARLQTGKLRPDRTLDLHGRTAQDAFKALHTFLAKAHADHLRCVEVITGRGAGEVGGILRRELPLWLNLPALRPHVLALTYPHKANQGSVRILLRRRH